MDYLSSMYIDNEMDLDEKKQFVQRVRSDDAFYTQTLELLAQEQLLRQLPVMPPESSATAPWRPSVWTVLASWFKPLGFATAGFTAAVLMLFSVFQPSGPPTVCNNRFVLFEPAADQVELAGSFTGWQRVSMTRPAPADTGKSTCRYPPGNTVSPTSWMATAQMADPTLPASEKDDFGGQNSILNVEARL
jgi:hypothetical protein